MPFVLNLFNVFALVYIFRGLQLLYIIWRNWAVLRQEPLLLAKVRLAEQASFFVSVPPGVFLHELSHAVAIWLFGGQVVEFGYRVFWGYVVPQGSFSLAQDWFISLAGTLGSLGYGVLLWWLLRQNRSSTIRYFALRSFRFQMHFALIYYPVMTLFLPIGDWRTIYDFAATPALSGVTAVCHLVLLGLFWRADRIGFFEMPAHETNETQQKFAELERVVQGESAVSPITLQQQLKYINTLRQGGATHRAQTALTQLLKTHPNSAEAHLELALLSMATTRATVSNKIAQTAQKAIQLGLTRLEDIACAYQLLGQRSLDMDQPEKAITEFTTALETLYSQSSNPEKLSTAYLHYLRSLAYRRQRRYPDAYQDIQRALSCVQDNKQASAYYQEQLTILQKHAGQQLGGF